MGDVSTSASKGIEHLSKFAVSERSIQSRSAKLYYWLITLTRLQPLFIRITRGKTTLLEKFETLLLPIACTFKISPRATCITALDRKVLFAFWVLRGIKEVRAHFEDLVICHIEKAEATACDARIKSKDKVVPCVRHLLILLPHCRSPGRVIDYPHSTLQKIKACVIKLTGRLII